MKANLSSLLRCTGLAAGAALALSGAYAAVPTDAFPNFDSYIKISGQAPSVTGDGAAYARRTQLSQDGGVGIEDLHYTKDLNKETSVVVDGHALAGSEDYLGVFKITQTDVGSFETGYKRFRTFYDGIGGFFPLNGAWMPLNNEDLHVDRGVFWAELKVNRPNEPVFTLRYTNAERTGTKDSTIWNDTDFTGLPNNNPPISQVRKIVPSYINLNERHQTAEGSIKHTVGKTTFELSLLGDTVKNLDTRYGTRFPGEAKPFPTPASTVLLPAAQMNNQIQYSQADGTDARTFGVTGRTETVFNDKVTLKLSAGYENLNNDFSGDRPLFTVTPTAVGNVIAATDNNLNLAGTSHEKVYTGIIALDLKPFKDFTADLALKGQDKYTKSTGSLISVTAATNTTTGVVTITQTPQLEYSRLKDHSLTPTLDLNYTHFKDVSFFASGSKDVVNGDEYYATPYASTGSPAASGLAFNDESESRSHYNAGASWRACQAVTLRGEVFYKDNVNHAVGYGINAGNNYELDTQFTGVKVTATAKINAQLTSTTRYIYQQGKAQVTGNLTTTPKYDSMDSKNHMICETIDWTPTAQFYFQANVNLVFNTISTIYPRAGIVPAAGTSIAWDANGVVHNSDNDYITASFLAGAVVSKDDDLQFKVTYYEANDYNPVIALLSVPYGAANKEFSATVGVKHRFTNRIMGDAKVGYIDNKSDLTGGNTNFRGPVAYLSLTYAL